MIQRPDRNECAPYYWTYFDKVPEGDILETLAQGRDEVASLFGSVPADRETWAYGPDKWTFRELLGHLIDTNQVFAHRAFWFARGGGELPGMDQDEFAAASNAADVPLAELLDIFRLQRDANLVLFGSFSDAALDRRGVASDAEITVRMLIHIIAGHEHHHLGVLRERYLAEASA
ncbi:MAG: DinB family protein [Acidobacteriota bacterium]